MPAYPLLALALLAFAVAVRLVLEVRARKLGDPIPLAPTLVATVILLGFTLVFDNVMIGAGLVRYEESTLSGVMLGLVPIEDLSYALAVSTLLPALWHRPRRGAHD